MLQSEGALKRQSVVLSISVPELAVAELLTMHSEQNVLVSSHVYISLV